MPKDIRSRLKEFSGLEFSDYAFPHIILNGRKEALIEGSRGVLEYKSDIVKINCGSCCVVFKGSLLQIRSPTASEISVTGAIRAVEIEETG